MAQSLNLTNTPPISENSKVFHLLAEALTPMCYAMMAFDLIWDDVEYSLKFNLLWWFRRAGASKKFNEFFDTAG